VIPICGYGYLWLLRLIAVVNYNNYLLWLFIVMDIACYFMDVPVDGDDDIYLVMAIGIYSCSYCW